MINIPPNAGDYAPRLTNALFAIATEPARKIEYVCAAKGSAWEKAIREYENPTEPYPMLFKTAIVHTRQGNLLSARLIELYERNFGETRNYVHYLAMQTREHKVPYLHVFTKNLMKWLGTKTPENLLARDDVIDVIENMKREGRKLKAMGGGTNTICPAYDWILDECEIDHEAIRSAEVGYDLGGGFATPHISRLFGKTMTSLDLNPPHDAEDIAVSIKPPKGVSLEEYHGRLKRQKWRKFNVCHDSLCSDYDSYFITSFGFATSTVGALGLAENDDSWKREFRNKSLFTTHCCMKALAELIARGKDVYFFLYGRPTTEIYKNKIIAMRFAERELLHHYAYKEDDDDGRHLLGMRYLYGERT